MLLQILEEGRLTDSTGKKVSFRNTFIIFTSNTSQAKEERCGFLGGEAGGQDKKIALELLKKHFPVEFLGRMDDYIQFNSLTASDLRAICRNELTALQQRLAAEGVSLSFHEDIIDYFVSDVNSLKGL